MKVKSDDGSDDDDHYDDDGYGLDIDGDGNEDDDNDISVEEKKTTKPKMKSSKLCCFIISKVRHRLYICRHAHSNTHTFPCFCTNSFIFVLSWLMLVWKRIVNETNRMKYFAK